MNRLATSLLQNCFGLTRLRGILVQAQLRPTIPTGAKVEGLLVQELQRFKFPSFQASDHREDLRGQDRKQGGVPYSF